MDRVTGADCEVRSWPGADGDMLSPASRGGSAGAARRTSTRWGRGFGSKATKAKGAEIALAAALLFGGPGRASRAAGGAVAGLLRVGSGMSLEGRQQLLLPGRYGPRRFSRRAMPKRPARRRRRFSLSRARD